jgi:hypothetical protein
MGRGPNNMSVAAAGGAQVRTRKRFPDRTGLRSSAAYGGGMPSTLTPQSTRTPALDSGVIQIARTDREVREVIDRWRALGPQTIAHDLECAASCTVPNGSGLHPHLGTIRLAQFAVRDRGDGRAEALVINHWDADLAPALELLTDPEWPVRVHYARMEIPWLAYNFGLRITNLVDTHMAAKRNYERQVEAEVWHSDHPEDIERAAQGLPPRWALGITCQRVIGFDMDKTQQNSHWDQAKLSDEQEEYAGVDVFGLLDIEPHVTSHLTPDDYAEMRVKLDEWTDRALELPPEGQLRKGCESERVLSMIADCRTVDELSALRRALPQVRVHYSARERVLAAFDDARARLERGIVPDDGPAVTMPGVIKPF